MKNLSTLLLALFLTSTVFAQDENVEPVHPMKDGTLEQFNLGENQNFTTKEKIVKVPIQGGIVDQSAAPDALVNNNDGATGTAYFTQSETDILAFGSNVLIGFNDSGSYPGTNSHFTGFSYSTDGGASFTDGGTFPSTDFGDPAMGRNDNTGRIYFSTLGNSTIQVFRSDDNGMTWMTAINGTPGGGSEDKQWLTVDNFAGSGNGNVYLISRSFGSGGIYMYRSTDNGNTFTPNGGTLIVSGNQGAFVAVGPDHSVYAFWYAGSTLQVRKSTDQAVTFGSAVTVASGLVGGVNGDLGLTGIRQGTSSASSFRSNEFPHAAVNPVSGHIYVTFANDAAGTDKADVFMTMSTDGGATWSASTRVNDDATTTDQWQPTIAVTPNGADIGIFYYSRQEDPSNNLFKYYGRTGTISGSNVSFTPSFAISDVASLPEFGRDNVVNSVYMGDYNHASATANEFHVVWSDNRDDLPGGAPRKDPNVYYEKITLGPPCPVGVASNPNPASGSTGVDINLPQISWTNGTGATSIEVFFDGASVYSGAPVTSYTIPATLNYSTTYSWKVDGSNDSCTTYGSSWTFTTIPDPNLLVDTIDVYPQDINYWTGTCDASTKTEVSLVDANGADFAGWMAFDISSIPNNATIVSITFNGYLYNNNWPYWAITPMGIVNPITGTATEIYNQASANYAEGIAYSYNAESGTLTNGWQQRPLETTAKADMESALGQGWFAIGIYDWDSGLTYFVNYEGWAETNVPYLKVIYESVVPVELTSFTAGSNGADVELTWSTATETNNQGFQVEKMNTAGTFEQIGYVAGFGTTTEPKAYSFTDSKLDGGTYSYRLKQIDFDGSYEYSDAVEVEVSIPAVYSLDQNYPNPFNPSTTIKYSIAEDGFVKLAVYNMLGEEVATIVNTTQKAGKYEVNFNASQLSSGVYVYRVEAANFTTSKKLMLLK